MIVIPHPVNEIMNNLSNKDFQVYCVGGFVRDAILGKKTHDIDIATNATPDQIIKILAQFNPKPTYPYGVSFDYGSYHFEITTMRKESSASNGRHPNTIEYINNIGIDSLRRDFTINAIYCDSNGLISDPLGGIKDIELKIIRTIGDPSVRFKEDSTRVIRLFYFASLLGFDIEKVTLETAYASLSTIMNLGAPSLFKTFKKILMGEHFTEIAIKHKELIKTLIPQFERIDLIEESDIDMNQKIYYQTMVMIGRLPKNDILRIAALFHSLGHITSTSQLADVSFESSSFAIESSMIAKHYLDLFEVPKKNKRLIQLLIELQDINIHPDYRFLQRIIYEYGYSLTCHLIEFQFAKKISNNENDQTIINNYATLRRMLDVIINEKYPLDPNDLILKLGDLKRIGIQERTAKKLLHYSFAAYLSGELENDFDEIMHYCKSLMEIDYQ